MDRCGRDSSGEIHPGGEKHGKQMEWGLSTCGGLCGCICRWFCGEEIDGSSKYRHQ